MFSCMLLLKVPQNSSGSVQEQMVSCFSKNVTTAGIYPGLTLLQLVFGMFGIP